MWANEHEKFLVLKYACCSARALLTSRPVHLMAALTKIDTQELDTCASSGDHAARSNIAQIHSAPCLSGLTLLQQPAGLNASYYLIDGCMN